MLRGVLLLCLVTVVVGCRSQGDKPVKETKSNEEPITRSPSGQFRGSWMTSRRGRQFEAYRGIKYAEPPVGELRFQPPKLILTYPGEVNATEDGPACPLPAPPTYPVDEDCLTVNVYTPGGNRDPNPLSAEAGRPSVQWPVMTPQDRKYLRVSSDLTVHEKMLEGRFQLWEELYPMKY